MAHAASQASIGVNAGSFAAVLEKSVFANNIAKVLGGKSNQLYCGVRTTFVTSEPSFSCAAGVGRKDAIGAETYSTGRKR